MNWTKRTAALVAVFALLAAGFAYSDTFDDLRNRGLPFAALVLSNGTAVDGSNPLPVTGSVTATSTPASSAATVTAASVGVTSAQALAGATRAYLFLENQSASAFVACSLGGTAALNTSGSIILTPYASKVWEGSFVPSDAVNCIASGAATPLTIVSK